MSDLLTITLDDMIQEVERELRARAQVYPNLIARGRLKQERADRQVEIMEAVRAHLHLSRRGRGA